MPDASVELTEGTADELAFDDHDEDDEDLSVENSLRRTGAWLTRITGCYHQMIADCAQRGVSSFENAAVRSMIGKIRSMENRSVRLLERAQNTFDEEDARQAFLMTEMFKNEVTYLEEFSQSLPAEANPFFSRYPFGSAAVTKMSSHLERCEKDAFESFRHFGELQQKIMQGLEERRALAERFGRDNLFRSYLLYACDSLKCVKAQSDWAPLSEGIVDELGTSFVYKREADSTQLSAHSPHIGHMKQEFDVDAGIWRWCETQPLFEEIPTESQYQNLEVQKEKTQWQNTFNREVELVLRRRHPHLNHPDIEWRDVLEFPVIELLRQYRRLSGK